LERAKFGYFIVLSLILHIFLLVAFRVNFHQKVEGFRPTYVRIVDLPFLEKEAETSKTKSGKGDTKRNLPLPLLSKDQRLLNPITPSPQGTSGEERGKSGIEEIKRADDQTPSPRDPSGKGIRGLPLITDKDLERFAKVEEPALKKKEKRITDCP